MNHPSESSPMARIHQHPPGAAFEVEIDDQPVPAFPGESVAAVLIAAGRRVFTQASPYNLARTLFCGMGLCHQCLVTVDGTPHVRACMTQAQPGMKIQTRITERRVDETG